MGTSEGKGDRNAKNLAQSPKIDKAKLADGKEYDLAPVNINILADLEDKFDMSFGDLMGSGRIKPLRYLVYLRLKPNYPDLTEDEVGKLIDMKVLTNIIKTIGME